MCRNEKVVYIHLYSIKHVHQSNGFILSVRNQSDVIVGQSCAGRRFSFFCGGHPIIRLYRPMSSRI